MTAFSAIDLEKLPSPDVVEPLDFETILSEMLETFRSSWPEYQGNLESDPVLKIFEVAAFRELHLRARINDASRAVMLAFAQNADLDNIAALFGVPRQVLDGGDSDAVPPIPPTLESDDRLRRRVQLSLEGLSTAGPEGSYVFHSLAADGRVKDVDVQSPSPGDVLVTVLSTENDGEASEDLIEAVNRRLNADDIRPLTDRVTVESADILRYEVRAELYLFEGPDSRVVMEAVNQAITSYTESRNRLGHDITISGVYAALHQPGVQRVELLSPLQTLVVANNQTARVNTIDVTVAGISE